MPRQAGTKIQNKFIRGLVTDSTALSFPEDACTEVSNVVFDSSGRVTRRLGFDTEADYTTDSVSLSAGDAYATFVWEAVSGDGDVSFLVVQQGETISFYDISSSAELSGNKHTTEVTLSDYLPAGSNYDPAVSLCQFASGDGNLFIVNSSCYPLYISYDIDGDSFTTTTISIEYRDFEGLEDEVSDTNRPTSTVAGMETNYPNHYYNLLNQGWFTADALSQWDSARSDMPSNVDYIALYRASETDSFNPNRVTANDPGNRLAPRGHYILEAGEDDRQTAIADEGYGFTIDTTSSSLIDPAEGTIYSNFETNESNLFDEDLDQNKLRSDAAQHGTYPSDMYSFFYAGKNYGSGNEKTINRVVLYPTADDGFSETENFNQTYVLYGNTGTPASSTDGTSLGSTILTTDQTNSLAITSNDTTTEYQYVWVRGDCASGNDVFYMAEMQIYSSIASFYKPSCVSFFAGRLFFGGINAPGINNNIYFSQIIESEDQYGRCYQKNDPTSEFFADLLPDDGGFIKIPEMGTLISLYSYQNALLIFASNGIWLLQGISGANFQADGYQIKKISSIGMSSPNSIISIKGLPAWWGDDGIYTIQFDANYSSFAAVSLTDNILESYYEDIPLQNRKYAKGAYDEIDQIAYWLYNDGTLGTDVYDYNTILCMDAKTKAFYEWEISAGPVLRSISYIKPADRSTDNKLKFLIHQNYTGSAADQTFGEVLNSNYLDWEEEGTNSDYDSYFITGYALDGQTQKFFQPNYVFVFLEQETNASCYVQGIYDFTNTVGTGKWSTKQQIYNENLLNRDVNFRRLKIRGKGRALQLRFESETQKPFTIIGWSLWETTNASI